MASAHLPPTSELCPTNKWPRVPPSLTQSLTLEAFKSYKYVNFAHYTEQENRIFLSTRSVVWPLNMPKMRFRPGLSPDPVGSSRRSPRAPSRLRTPLPDFTPLSAFDASIIAPSMLATCAPVQAWYPRCFRAGYGPVRTWLEDRLESLLWGPGLGLGNDNFGWTWIFCHFGGLLSATDWT